MKLKAGRHRPSSKAGVHDNYQLIAEFDQVLQWPRHVKIVLISEVFDNTGEFIAPNGDS